MSLDEGADIDKPDDTTTTTTATTTTTKKTTTTTTTTVTTSTESKTSTTIDAPEAFYGDVNLDGTVSLIDVVYLNKALAGSITLNDQQKLNADCCYDNKSNSADVTALLQYNVESITVLPVLPVE